MFCFQGHKGDTRRWARLLTLSAFTQNLFVHFLFKKVCANGLHNWRHSVCMELRASWAYRAVVWTWVWPKSFWIMVRLWPSARALEVEEWRRSRIQTSSSPRALADAPLGRRYVGEIGAGKALAYVATSEEGEDPFSTVGERDCGGGKMDAARATAPSRRQVRAEGGEQSSGKKGACAAKTRECRAPQARGFGTTRA